MHAPSGCLSPWWVGAAAAVRRMAASRARLCWGRAARASRWRATPGRTVHRRRRCAPHRAVRPVAERLHQARGPAATRSSAWRSARFRARGRGAGAEVARSGPGRVRVRVRVRVQVRVRRAVTGPDQVLEAAHGAKPDHCGAARRATRATSTRPTGGASRAPADACYRPDGGGRVGRRDERRSSSSRPPCLGLGLGLGFELGSG